MKTCPFDLHEVQRRAKSDRTTHTQ